MHIKLIIWIILNRNFNKKQLQIKVGTTIDIRLLHYWIFLNTVEQYDINTRQDTVGIAYDI